MNTGIHTYFANTANTWMDFVMDFQNRPTYVIILLNSTLIISLYCNIKYYLGKELPTNRNQTQIKYIALLHQSKLVCFSV